HHSFHYLTPPPPRSTLFPYTTLFRSMLTFSAGASGTDADSGTAVQPAAVTAPTVQVQAPGALSATASAMPARVSAGLQQVSLVRSEEHTSELQSRGHLVCRLLLEKKK